MSSCDHCIFRQRRTCSSELPKCRYCRLRCLECTYSHGTTLLPKRLFFSPELLLNSKALYQVIAKEEIEARKQATIAKQRRKLKRQLHELKRKAETILEEAETIYQPGVEMPEKLKRLAEEIKQLDGKLEAIEGEKEQGRQDKMLADTATQQLLLGMVLAPSILQKANIRQRGE